VSFFFDTGANALYGLASVDEYFENITSGKLIQK
jgi:hypothetical protein